MRELWPAILLAFPPMLYVGAVVLGSAPTASAAFAGLFVITFFLAVLSTLPDRRVRVGTTGAFILLAAVALGSSVAGRVGADVLAGVLLASPALLLSFAVLPEGTLALRLTALGLALLDGLALLAARGAVLLSALPLTGRSFLAAFVAANVDQVKGLIGLLSSAGGALPLRDTFDPVYIVLAGISAVGVLIPMLRPEDAWGAALPVEGNPPAGAGPSEATDLDPALAEELASRSQPEPPVGLPPGIPALVSGSVAAVGVVSLAFVAPTVPLLVLVVLLLAGLFAAIAASRRSHPSPPS